MIDIREQPVTMQRAAFKQGLIPYVPADRAAAAVQERISTSMSRRLFQFKITLRGTEPVIWRRIQVFDDTLDKIHEHIQPGFAKAGEGAVLPLHARQIGPSLTV
jgi:hypothetical protein